MQVAPGAEEAVAYCGGLRALLAAVGVPVSLELPGVLPAADPSPDTDLIVDSLRKGGSGTAAAVQVGGAQPAGAGVPQDPAGDPCREIKSVQEPLPQVPAEPDLAECADPVRGPLLQRAAARGPNGRLDPGAMEALGVFQGQADTESGSSREAVERMPGSGGAADLDDRPNAGTTEHAGGSGTARGPGLAPPGAGLPPVPAAANPAHSGASCSVRVERPVRIAWPHYAGVVAVLRGRRHDLRDLLGPAGLVPDGTLAALR